MGDKRQEKTNLWKALLVNANHEVQTFLMDSVSDYGYEPVVCRDEGTAWRCFEELHPRLVVLDLDHTEAVGVDLCRRIRLSPLGKYVAILVLSSGDRPEDFEEAISAGADQFFPKPLRPKVFAAYLIALHAKLQQLRDLQESDSRIAIYENELEAANDQLQEAIGRANQLAMEAELAYLELNQVFRNAADGIRVIDKNMNVLRFNRTFMGVSEAPEDEVLQRKCHDSFTCSLCRTEDCPLPHVLGGQDRFAREVSKKGRDGETTHYIITAIPFRAPDGELVGIVEYILDITARVRAEEALKESEKRYRELSQVDELTKLYNKRFFKKQLSCEIAHSIRYKQALSLLILDIDNFKHHNDTYGHPEGDKVLAKLGEIIRTTVRTTDWACRYGGEEFSVLLPSTRGEDAFNVAERIRKAVEREVFRPGRGIEVTKTVSIGATQYVEGEEQEKLIARADRNLYAAKKQGKNRCLAE